MREAYMDWDLSYGGDGPQFLLGAGLFESLDHRFGSQDTYDTFKPNSIAQQETPGGSHLSQASTSQLATTSDGHVATIQLGSQYRVEDFFARGGLGELYRAQDISLGRRVALKVLQRPLDDEARRQQRFLREAAITGRLEHPGVAPVYGVGQSSEGRLCYAMRFIEGETLAQAVSRNRALLDSGQAEEATLQLRRLLSRFISVCNTIAFAHSQRIVHRDIKPANIVFGPYGETFVIDWGLAKSLSQTAGQDDACDVEDESVVSSQDSELTGQGMILGTPAFMAPEQADSTAEVGFSADIYGLGATLFYLLTGRPPIRESSLNRLLERVRSGAVDRPRDIVPSVARPLEAICLKALALDLKQRYPSALELAGDIERFLADQPVTAYQEDTWQLMTRVIRRHRAIAQSAALFLVCLSLVTVVFSMVMFYQWQVAQRARREAESLTVETQRLANDKADLAAAEAVARRTAQEQSALSLATLRSVILDIQRKLSNVSGAVEARRSMLQTAIAGLERVASSVKSSEDVDRNLVIALNDIGGIYLIVGQSTGKDATQEALNCFTMSVEKSRKLLARDETPEALRDLSVAFEKMGEAHWQLGQLDQAEAAYRESFALSERLNRDGEFDRDLAFGFEKIGDVCNERGDGDAALTAYLRSHELFLAALKRHPDSLLVKRDVVVSRSKLGNLYQQREQLDEAIEAYSQCIAQLQELIVVADSPVSRRDLSVTYNKLGSTYQLKQEYDAAEAAFQDSLLQARTHLADEPQNSQRRRDVTISLNNLATLYVTLMRLDVARDLFSESLAIRRQTSQLSPESLPAKIDLAYTLSQLADTERQAGNADTARSHWSEALQLLEPYHAQQKLQTAFSKELYQLIVKKLDE